MSTRNSPIQRFCVYCGSSEGARPEYVLQAQEMGRALAARGWGLVYGGGGIGLMGACAAAALAEGGEVIGIIPHALASKERLNQEVTELRVVRTMHERKAMMVDLSDGFIALPGGFGTFDELFETITWAQLGIHQKPIGILNTTGYFDPLVAMAERAISEGFVRPQYRNLLIIEDNLERLLDRMMNFEPLPGIVKWVELSET